MTKGILWGVLITPINVERRYPCGEPHHITLQYGVEKSRWAKFLGKEFEAHAILEAWNSRIQAVVIQLPDFIPCSNTNPHISVSWEQGIKPVESNAMLAGKHDCKKISKKLKFKIEFLKWLQPIP